jgi:hypothetical protein
VGALLNKIEDLLRESLVGLGPCCRVVLGHFVSGCIGGGGGKGNVLLSSSASDS